MKPIVTSLVIASIFFVIFLCYRKVNGHHLDKVQHEVVGESVCVLGDIDELKS